MSAVPPDELKDLFEAETSRFRQVLAKGRSANQLALFDLLVERSNDQRSPKEVEIALELFGSEATLETPTDSGVRVYVHRLRKRIDDHYAGKAGPRLSIPKGEYRIVLEVSDDQPLLARALGTLTRLCSANPALVVGLSLIAIAGLTFVGSQFWSIRPPQPSAAARERQALFGVGASLSDPIIAVGDSLMLAETLDQRSVQRMILNPTIRTRDDFGQYLKDHPEVFYRLYDFNLNFAPMPSVQAAWAVQDEMAATEGGRPRARIVPVSALNPAQIQAHDIIFVGRLSQLGVLEQPVLAQSRLRLAAYDRLVDSVDGTVLEGQVYFDDTARTKPDIGYLATLTGPTGRRLVVLAGLGDRGTASMAALLNAPKELAMLRKRLGARRNFEAVFQVRTPPGRPPERRLIATYPQS